MALTVYVSTTTPPTANSCSQGKNKWLLISAAILAVGAAVLTGGAALAVEAPTIALFTAGSAVCSAASGAVAITDAAQCS